MYSSTLWRSYIFDSNTIYVLDPFDILRVALNEVEERQARTITYFVIQSLFVPISYFVANTMVPDSIKKFIDRFSELPSIGPRQATRLAFYLVNKGKATVDDLARAVAGLGELQNCATCFRVAKVDMKKNCPICADPRRTADLIAIVEKETDLLSIEQTKKFNGRYLVIGELEKDGFLSSAQKLQLNSLKSALAQLPARNGTEAGKAEEIILAINPTAYGDMHAALLTDELKPYAKRITRLGRGLPTGGEIEFADEETLGGALEHRA